MNVFALLLALASTYNNDLPPVKYQVNPPMSLIVIVTNTNTKGACGVAEKGYHFLACEDRGKNGTPVITMPNPCTYPEAKNPDSYAHLLCHEFGHANGWNSAHNN